MSSLLEIKLDLHLALNTGIQFQVNEKFKWKDKNLKNTTRKNIFKKIEKTLHNFGVKTIFLFLKIINPQNERQKIKLNCQIQTWEKYGIQSKD